MVDDWIYRGIQPRKNKAGGSTDIKSCGQSGTAGDRVSIFILQHAALHMPRMIVALIPCEFDLLDSYFGLDASCLVMPCTIYRRMLIK